MKKKSIFILLFSFIFLFSLSSCKKNKFEYCGYHKVTDDYQLYLGCNVNVNNSLSKTTYMSLAYAKDSDYTFTDSYSIYYFQESYGAVKIMDCSADFGTSDTYNVRYADRYEPDETSYYYRVGFYKNTYTKIALDYTMFPGEVGAIGRTFLILSKDGSVPTTNDEITNYTNIVMRYEVGEKKITFIY